MIILDGIIIYKLYHKDIKHIATKAIGGTSDFSMSLMLRSIMVELTPYALIVTDLNGLILMWNKRAESKFGWLAEEVVNVKNISIIIPDEYRHLHESGLKRYRETGKSRLIDNEIGKELTAIHKTGRKFPIHLKLVSILHNGVRLVGGFARNITKEIGDRESCEKRIHFLHETLNIAELAGWEWDLDTGKVITYDDFHRLYDVDDDVEITAPMLMDLIYPEDQLKVSTVINHAFRHKENYRVFYRRKQADGSLIYLDCIGKMILDSEGEIEKVRGTIQAMGIA